MYATNDVCLLKNHPRFGVFNLLWTTQCAVLLLSLKYNFLEDTQYGFFVQYDLLDLPTQVYSSVSKTLSFSNFD